MRAYSLSSWHPEPEPLTAPESSLPPPSRCLLKSREAAGYVGCSVQMLRRYAREPDGPMRFVLGRTHARYAVTDLDDWLARRRRQGMTARN
jgi:hypothetical protein